jgi:hypothetical protein
MIALSSIAAVAPEKVYVHLAFIRQTVDKGSVITKDAGMALYAHLAKVKKYHNEVFPLLLAELEKCPIKQLPQYAEKASRAIDLSLKKQFVGIIEKRMSELVIESRIGRIRKVLADLKQ